MERREGAKIGQNVMRGKTALVQTHQIGARRVPKGQNFAFFRLPPQFSFFLLSWRSSILTHVFCPICHILFCPVAFFFVPTPHLTVLVFTKTPPKFDARTPREGEKNEIGAGDGKKREIFGWSGGVWWRRGPAQEPHQHRPQHNMTKNGTKWVDHNDWPKFHWPKSVISGSHFWPRPLLAHTTFGPPPATPSHKHGLCPPLGSQQASLLKGLG